MITIYKAALSPSLEEHTGVYVELSREVAMLDEASS